MFLLLPPGLLRPRMVSLLQASLNKYFQGGWIPRIYHRSNVQPLLHELVLNTVCLFHSPFTFSWPSEGGSRCVALGCCQ